jgi:hypothetical protein
VPYAKSQKYSEIEHIAEAIWLGRYSRANVMGLLSAAYFDASGKQKGYPFLTVAGAVSPIKKWIRFERQWMQALDDEGVTEFHATDFAASQGEYEAWKGDKQRRSAFVKRLVGIIQKNTNKLFLLTVEIKIWEQVNGEYPLGENFHSAYALAGFSVAALALRWATKKRVRKTFDIYFEDGDEGWGGLNELCKKHLQFEPIRIPKSKAVPFQVGDFLSWKARITATNAMKIVDGLQRGDKLDEVMKELDSLNRILVCPVKNGIYTAEGLRGTCRNLKIPKRPAPASVAGHRTELR